MKGRPERRPRITVRGVAAAAATLACTHIAMPSGTGERAERLCRVHPERLPDAAFSTDGCSAWPDGDWQACCIEHDFSYEWAGMLSDPLDDIRSIEMPHGRKPRILAVAHEARKPQSHHRRGESARFHDEALWRSVEG